MPDKINWRSEQERHRTLRRFYRTFRECYEDFVKMPPDERRLTLGEARDVLRLVIPRYIPDLCLCGHLLEIEDRAGFACVFEQRVSSDVELCNVLSAKQSSLELWERYRLRTGESVS